MLKIKVLRDKGGQFRFRVRLSLAKAIDQTIKEQQQKMIKETPRWFATTSKWYLPSHPTGYRIARTKLVRGDQKITGQIYTFNNWSLRQEIGGYQSSLTTPIYEKTSGKVHKARGGMNARYAGFLKKVWKNKRIGQSAKERQARLKKAITVRRGKKVAVFFDKKSNSLKIVKKTNNKKRKSKSKSTANKDKFYMLLKPLSGSNSSTFLVTKPKPKKKGINQPLLLSINKSNIKTKGKGQIEKLAKIYMPKVIDRLYVNLIKVSNGLRV